MWKTQYRFWERAKPRELPQALLDALSSVSENYRQAYERLNELPVLSLKKREQPCGRAVF